MIGILAGAFMTATRTPGFAFRAEDAQRQGFADWVRDRIDAAMRRSADIRTARDLIDMDDALLRDIGLTRDEADRLARYGRIEDPRG